MKTTIIELSDYREEEEEREEEEKENVGAKVAKTACVCVQINKRRAAIVYYLPRVRHALVGVVNLLLLWWWWWWCVGCRVW
jgi:hypothetical protein